MCNLANNIRAGGKRYKIDHGC